MNIFHFQIIVCHIDHFRGDVMAYILENVNILKNGELSRTSLLVEHGKITLMKPSLDRFRFMKMDGDSFIMTRSTCYTRYSNSFSSTISRTKGVLQ